MPSFVLANDLALRRPRKASVVACLNSWQTEFPDYSAAIEIFGDLDCTISWLSEQTSAKDGSFWTQLDVDALCLDIDAFCLLPLIHRCLQLSSTAADGVDCNARSITDIHIGQTYQEALRHAIVIFISPIRRCFGLPALGTDLQLTKLIRSLQACQLGHARPELEQVAMWILIVGAWEASRLGRDTGFFFFHILHGITAVGVRSFDEVRAIIEGSLHELVWLDEVMSPTYKVMMTELQAYTKLSFAA